MQKKENSLQESAEALLEQIKFALADGKDSSALESDFALLTGKAQKWQKRLDKAKSEGRQRYKEKNALSQAMRHGLLSAEMKVYWQTVPGKPLNVPSWIAKQISRTLGKEVQDIAKNSGRKAAEAHLQQARKLYGISVHSVQIPEDMDERGTQPVDIVQHTVHTLWTRQVAPVWHVYIDENGESFSALEEGKMGRVVAVAVPEGSPLGNPGSFHATESSPRQILEHCNTLLQSDCGVLGFTCPALDIQGEDGWLQAIRDLVKWVWRLLPLSTEGTGLHVHVEQRGVYSGKLTTLLSAKNLQAEMTGEDPKRAAQMRILQFTFEDKTAPMLAWADIVAYLWGRQKGVDFKVFRKSGLAESCLIHCPASRLKTLEDIFTGKTPDGAAWIGLMQEKARKGSLLEHALARLQQRCHAQPGLWKTYAQAMQDYLASKKYRHDVLERMSVWLRPMSAPGLAAEFYWHCAELARLNHLGDVDSDALHNTVQALERLTPKMASLDMTASLHVALRLAVADSNAFAFARSQARLDAWNPAVGGRLTGSALWDGKILSSLGQFRAFQNDPTDAVRLFEEALERFAVLEEADPEEAKRQRQQTATYLAVACMDMPDADTAHVRRTVETALGMPVLDAAHHFGRKPLEDSPYPHYLLARYLAWMGTEEEKTAYEQRAFLWTEPEKGVLPGHPWPQIQYFRWLMTDRDDDALRRELANSLDYARGKDNMPTVELIVLAIAISMGQLNPGKPAVQNMLHTLAERMPDAQAIVRQLQDASPGDSGLARRIIPFNFC
ncbi:MAG: hypothetical protein IJU37_00995 [Desulfovibrio sp.]|nr:hypothetical protein [Desulfovibrio sp.]